MKFQAFLPPATDFRIFLRSRSRSPSQKIRVAKGRIAQRSTRNSCKELYDVAKGAGKRRRRLILDWSGLVDEDGGDDGCYSPGAIAAGGEGVPAPSESTALWLDGRLYLLRRIFDLHWLATQKDQTTKVRWSCRRHFRRIVKCNNHRKERRRECSRS